MMVVKIDKEFKKLVPVLSDDEYKGLEQSIVDEGCRDAIILWNDFIVDGHNRYEICSKHGIDFRTVDKEFSSRDDAKVWIIKNQFGRRNLSLYQRSLLALELEGIFRKMMKERHALKSTALYKKVVEVTTLSPLLEVKAVKTRGVLAEIAKVSQGTMAKVKVIKESGTQEQKKRVEGEQASISEIYNEIRGVVKRVIPGLVRGVIRREEKVVKYPKAFPEGKFNVIYADPPWKYDFSVSDSRKIENQYPTMEIEEICKLQIPDAENSILFLWATAPKLLEALRVMKAWGFQYKTNAIWDKKRIGMGYYFRGRHELLLVGTKGSFSPPMPENRFGSVIVATRSEHSKKPNEVYGMIEKMYPVDMGYKYLELFARQKYSDGWNTWGMTCE